MRHLVWKRVEKSRRHPFSNASFFQLFPWYLSETENDILTEPRRGANGPRNFVSILTLSRFTLSLWIFNRWSFVASDESTIPMINSHWSILPTGQSDDRHPTNSAVSKTIRHRFHHVLLSFITRLLLIIVGSSVSFRCHAQGQLTSDKYHRDEIQHATIYNSKIQY